MLDAATLRMFEAALAHFKTRFGEVDLTCELRDGKVMVVIPKAERPRITRENVRERGEGIVS